MTALSPGDYLGHYKVESVLGQGAMGIVYLAFEESLNRRVALKVLSPRLCEVEGFIERFKREAEAVAKLRHPNILQIYTIGNDKGHHYFAMEFVEGDSLAQVLKNKGALELERGMDLIEQISKGLMSAHDEGVVHRDIKPSNIMVDASGRATIMDFGIAKMEMDEATDMPELPSDGEDPPTGARITMAGEVIGTPEYMAPEQAMGKDIDERVDIYALGTVAYEMLAGRLPFGGGTFSELSNKKLTEQPNPMWRGQVTDAQRRLEAIVRRSLAADPTHRIQSCRQFLKGIMSIREEIEREDEVKKRKDLSVQLTSTALAKDSRRRAIPLSAWKWIAWGITGALIVGMMVILLVFGDEWSEVSVRTGQQASVEISSANEGEVVSVGGTVVSLDTYADGLWIEIEYVDGSCWVFASGVSPSSTPLEVGCTVKVKGQVSYDDGMGETIVDASKQDGLVEVKGRRSVSSGEKEAMRMAPVPVENLRGAKAGLWASVRGEVLAIEDFDEPIGIWVEMGPEDEPLGVWIPDTVLSRLRGDFAEGETITVIGVLKGEDPPLVASMDLISGDHLRAGQ